MNSSKNSNKFQEIESSRIGLDGWSPPRERERLTLRVVLRSARRVKKNGRRCDVAARVRRGSSEPKIRNVQETAER